MVSTGWCPCLVVKRLGGVFRFGVGDSPCAKPRVNQGIAPRLSDAELVTLAVLQALLGFDSEARFIRYATAHLHPWFLFVPQRPGYNKRLRRSGELMKHMIGALARDCPSFHDDVWGRGLDPGGVRPPPRDPEAL